jgi:hypothetical protein
MQGFGKYQATAFSILLFTESTPPSGFFHKKKPPLMHFQCQYVNRKRSSLGFLALSASSLPASAAVKGRFATLPPAAASHGGPLPLK